MKYEYLADWVFCYLFPLTIFFVWGFKIGLIYVGCSLFWALTRIGNMLREISYGINN